MRTRTRMTTKKKLAALTSLVLVGALLIGGAFAWTDFSQSFINRFRGGVTPDVLLHDDFEPWLNKDVYVENTGEQDLIVRVKFNEFLQIGNKVIVGDDANDKDEWDTHLFTEAPEYGSGDPDSEDYGLCYDCALETHTYFQWYMTGAKKTYLHGTSEQGNEDWNGQSIEDPNNLGPNDMMFGETQEASEIMTMEQWIASDKSAACWVLDADGWAYWSQALAPTKATNLLLDNVKLIQKPDDNFYYAIDVILNASNKSEAAKLYDEASDEAEEYIINPIAASTQNNPPDTVEVNGKDITINGEGWRIINQYDDYYLILKKNCLGTPVAYGNDNIYSTSPVRAAVNNWFNALPANSVLKINAVPSDATTTKIGIMDRDYSDNSIIESGFSVPLADNGDRAFILSTQEASKYCSLVYYDTGTEVPSSLEAQENWNSMKFEFGGDGDYLNSWFRSPYFGYSDYAGNLEAFGRAINDDVHSMAEYIRPALWVKADILNP